MRIHHLVAATPEGAGLIGPLEGVVEYAEALGRETFLGVRRDGGPRLVVRVEAGPAPSRATAWPTCWCPAGCASSTRRRATRSKDPADPPLPVRSRGS